MIDSAEVVLDGFGVYGQIFHVSILIALVSSTLLIFLVLFFKNRLDMDEEPKFRLFSDDDADHFNNKLDKECNHERAQTNRPFDRQRRNFFGSW